MKEFMSTGVEHIRSPKKIKEGNSEERNENMNEAYISPKNRNGRSQLIHEYSLNRLIIYFHLFSQLTLKHPDL